MIDVAAERPEFLGVGLADLHEPLLRLQRQVKDDPTSAREALRRALQDGKLVMHPQPDGSYVADSMILPLRLGPRTRKPRPGSPSGAVEVVGSDGCAGAQLDFPHREFPEVSPCWVPFEGSIAIGWD